MNRIAARITKLECDSHTALPWWAGTPVDEWPDGALTAFLRAREGWSADHEPTEAEFEAAFFGGRDGDA